MAKRPFFSIVIPTYNRSHYLRLAVKSVLLQNFTDFEIVISDNSENNKSGIVCRKFKDRRIRYFKNKTNIGPIKNIYQAIKQANGEYIFLLGDDDLLFSNNVLFNAFQSIRKYGYGFIRLKYIYHKEFQYLYSVTDFEKNRVYRLGKNQENIDVYNFIYNTGFGFISGVVFKNLKNFEIAEIEKPFDHTRSWEFFWIKFIYPAAKLYGGLLDLNNLILSHAPREQSDYRIYDVVNNKIFLEYSWELIFDNMSKTERIKWIKKYTTKVISVLPSIKFYAGRKNLLLNTKRILELNPDLYFNPGLYFWGIFSLLMPNILWKLIRFLAEKRQVIHNEKLFFEMRKLKKELRSH